MENTLISDGTLLELIFNFSQKRGIYNLKDNMSKFRDDLNCLAVFLFEYETELKYQVSKTPLSIDKYELDCYYEHFHENVVLQNNMVDFFSTEFHKNTCYYYRIQENNWLILLRKTVFDKALSKKVRKIIALFANHLTSINKSSHNVKNGVFVKDGWLNDIDSDTFKDIVDHADNSILIANEDAVLCYANKTSTKWLGIGKNTQKDINVYNYEKLFQGNKEHWKKHLEELKTVPKVMANGSLVNFKTGNIITTEALIRYTPINGQGYVIAISKDITKQKMIQKEIHNERKLQEILLRIASAYINIELSNIKNMINSSLKEIGTFVDADRAYIFEYNFSDQTTSNTYEWCAENISPEIKNLQNVPIGAIPQWVTAHKNKKSFYINDVSKLPDSGPDGLRAILEPQGIKSLITIPMFNSGKLSGFVGFDSVRVVKKYTEREENLLLVYAEILVNIKLRQKYELELMNQKDRFRRIISSIDLGLIEVDEYFNIMFANNSFLKFYGYKWSEVLGLNLFRTIFKSKDENELKKILTKIKKNEVLAKEITTYNRQGEEKTIFLSFVKHNDQNGITRYQGALLDLSEHKKLELELRNSMQKTEEASKAKELFLANMSHELRTPLNIINGVITEIGKEKISQDTNFLLNQANAASAHVLNLVNNILDFAKINAGEIKLERKEFQFSTTIQNTFNIFSLMANEKGLKYKLSIDKEIYDYVIGDYGKLNQILINLLGNAIKFTENGYVKMNIALNKNFKSKQKLDFTIVDTGIGMHLDFQKKVFSEFQQDTSTNSNQSGTGLGMPISKRLLEIMGSDIYLNSLKNYGTTIKFSLELEKRYHKQFEEVNTLNNQLLKNKKILIVEDNYMNALLLERRLLDLGAVTFKAENGKLGVDHVCNSHVDLVLMDIQMPVMNGIEATLAIREKYGKSLPIIAITANVFKENIDQCLKAGMNDFIIKPFEVYNVITKILKALRINRKFNDKIDKKIDLEIEDIDYDYSLEKLNDISNGDNSFFTEMVEVFCNLANSSVKQLKEATEKRDQSIIKNIAHKLRTSLSDIKANRALVLAKHLDSPKEIDWDDSYQTSIELISVLNKISEEMEKKYLRTQKK